ncbi:MAG: helix-turn-helix transcriptional regulator [Streptomyces sp.]|uniref:helix-turn-helix transcriptional regulator n=1 Tax=Streptomyces sp. TaxID=1931 RepID=UPI0025F9F936|nr:helix-turn-helix transcriptional regulator [Streptomyces sp.]MBW8799112.1 helix-turn-helix transcriptional regulator [Streptomyces sp.]
MTRAPHAEHGLQDLCTAGTRLYERALDQGHIRAPDAAEAPCLVALGLLHPAPADPGRLEPVAPAVALDRLLRGPRVRIAGEWRRQELLAELFAPLMRLAPGSGTVPASTPALRLLSGTRRINQAIAEAMAQAREEILCIQPHAGMVGERGTAAESVAYERDKSFLDRGGRVRTLYQNTLFHVQTVYTYAESLKGDNVARGLDEVPDRLIVVDRSVAFLPADDDGSTALEVRHPALVGYFATAFARLWHLATPMFPKAEHRPSVNGVTPRQQAIAALLVEGHTDAVIAARLGMNIRTARVHIAKLAATLGSESRAQLGYLIGESGILKDREGRP